MVSSNNNTGVCRLSNDILLLQIPPEPNLEWMAKIERKYPGLKVRWVRLDFQKGLKFERGLAENKIEPEVWKGVTLACLFLPHPADLMSQVRYLQLTSAGVDLWVGHERYKNPDVAICSASGMHPPQIAEWVMGTWLMMSHSLLRYASFQKEAKWCHEHADVVDSPGLRMGILGYGALGRQIARLAEAMGMEVYAFTRTPRITLEQRKDNSYHLPGTGDPEGRIPAKWFSGDSKESINDFLSQDLDLLVISLPLTSMTESIIGSEQFDILAKNKGKTFISNVGRGKHIDTDALVEALHQGKIRGAAVDVTNPEPLPDGHPLFTAPNVIVTPHVSWKSVHIWERLLEILETNLEKLNAGEGLINVVNKEQHY